MRVGYGFGCSVHVIVYGIPQKGIDYCCYQRNNNNIFIGVFNNNIIPYSSN